jgi:hypothetical protein
MQDGECAKMVVVWGWCILVPMFVLFSSQIKLVLDSFFWRTKKISIEMVEVSGKSTKELIEW